MAFSQQHYDIIIAGTGCSGLSLAWHLLSRGELQNQNIAIIDDGTNEPLNKTWCFWHTDALPDPVPIHKSWENLEVYANDFHQEVRLQGLKYHCVNSEEYTAEMVRALKSFPNLDWFTGPVESAEEEDRRAIIRIPGWKLTASHYFQSFGEADMSKSKFRLLQHFKGIEIRTKDDLFDTETARFMDFRTSQNGGATFFYVLPYEKNRALVEYTLFSPTLLDEGEYDAAIKEYLNKHLDIQEGDYEIEREEFGVIPMADQIFRPGAGKRLHYIGTPSGIPKASTGYAFSRIHRQARQIAAHYAQTGKVRITNPSAAKYRKYDVIMLDVLTRHPDFGRTVFESLFRGNPLERVLRFIDEKSTLSEDVRVMASVPIPTFLKATLRNL
ncbi:MAG: hypothetical protein LAT84_13430 [Balneolia bacterium]|nr:hypothetical protein [Balneolia bacterium]